MEVFVKGELYKIETVPSMTEVIGTTAGEYLAANAKIISDKLGFSGTDSAAKAVVVQALVEYLKTHRGNPL